TLAASRAKGQQGQPGGNQQFHQRRWWPSCSRCLLSRDLEPGASIWLEFGAERCAQRSDSNAGVHPPTRAANAASAPVVPGRQPDDRGNAASLMSAIAGLFRPFAPLALVSRALSAESDRP